MERPSFRLAYLVIAVLLCGLAVLGADLAERSGARETSNVRFTYLEPGRESMSWQLHCRHPAEPGACRLIEGLAGGELLTRPGRLSCPNGPTLQITGDARSRPVHTIVDLCDGGRWELLFGLAVAALPRDERVTRPAGGTGSGRGSRAR